MTTCSLTLQPYGKPSFTIGVSENDGRKSSIEQAITKSSDICVFSDLSYEFVLTCEETIAAQDVNVYINDVHEPSVYNNGRITFPGDGSSVRRIFMDCYGFVQISLIVSDNSGNKHQYTSEYLPVLVRRGELNDAVKAMVNYVYSNQEILLLNGEPKAKSPANLKEMGYQISLLRLSLLKRLQLFTRVALAILKLIVASRLIKWRKLIGLSIYSI